MPVGSLWLWPVDAPPDQVRSGDPTGHDRCSHQARPGTQVPAGRPVGEVQLKVHACRARPQPAEGRPRLGQGAEALEAA